MSHIKRLLGLQVVDHGPCEKNFLHHGNDIDVQENVRNSRKSKGSGAKVTLPKTLVYKGS